MAPRTPSLTHFLILVMIQEKLCVTSSNRYFCTLSPAETYLRSFSLWESWAPPTPRTPHNSDILKRRRRRCRVIRSQDIKPGAISLSNPRDIRVGLARQIGKDLVWKHRAVSARRAGKPASVVELEQAEIITGNDSEVAQEGVVWNSGRVHLCKAEGSTWLDVNNLSARNCDILNEGRSQWIACYW